MAVIPTSRELKEMISVAMQDRAPKMFAELKAANELDAAIEQRAEMARETYLTTMGEKGFQIAKTPSEDPMEQVSRATSAMREAWESAFAQAIEFPEETSETTSPEVAA